MASHPAIAHVAALARSRQAVDRDRVEQALGSDRGTSAEFIAGIQRAARLTVNFHPDRRDRRGLPVVDGLLRDGRYRSQFATGISSGGRFAVGGGPRDRWEHELFGGAYDGMVGVDDVRPVYGSLDLTHDLHGGSPRFGSCALVLADRCLDRATLTVGDSHLGPTDIGTAASFDGIAAGLLEGALVPRGIDIDALTRLAADGPTSPKADRDLDHYVEAQIHDGVSLATDVEMILADPSFRSTAIGASLETLAEAHSIGLRWHPGSRVHVDQIPDEFRGSATVELGHQIATETGEITAAMIGQSAASIEWTPPSAQGDAEDSPLQLHKRLWHAVLALGEPFE